MCRFVDLPLYEEEEGTNDKVRDHCHLTGKSRGASYIHCNIYEKHSHSSFIPIAVLNMANHDSQSFIKGLINRKHPSVSAQAVVQIDGRFLSFSYGRLRFFDSMNFMKKSLDRVVKTRDLDNFIHTRRVIGKKWELITIKLTYTYEYLGKLEDYKKQLPGIEKKLYFSNLTGKTQNDEDIAGKNELIRELTIKTGMYFTMFCCTSDTILLADSASKFQKESLEIYGLDPFYCISMHGHTFDCTLNEGKLQVE